MNWQTANNSEPQQPTSIDNALVAWSNAAKELQRAIDRERELRQIVFDSAFPKAEEGTNTLELGHGWKLKGVKKVNYRLDKKNVDSALDEIEKSGSEGEFIAERLVKWSPELSLTEYRKLSPDHRRIIDSVVTKKDGLPTLELVPPPSS